MENKATSQRTGDFDEAELIARAQSGDPAAFETLYKAHSKHVYSVCLRMLRNSAESEDLTQQVFLQLFRKIGAFRGEASLSTWLHRITVNAVLMHLRRVKRKEASFIAVDDAGTNDPDRCEVIPADHSVSDAVDRISLKRAIRQLPDGCKRLFLLHDVMGYRHGEIAKLIGCSVGCSKSQVHRARKRLRQLLRGTAVQAIEVDSAVCGQPSVA